MDDFFSPSSTRLSYWLDPTYGKNSTQTAPGLALNTTNGQAASASQPDFNSLLEVLLLGMKMDEKSASGMRMGELVAPLVLTLLEKMLAQQVNGQLTREATPSQAGQPAGTSPETQLPPGSTPIPKGLPVQGRLTQNFHPGHNGIDWGAPLGSPVKATMDGKVIYAGWNNQGYGNLVIVENGAYRTYYAHLSQIPVSVGQTVGAGSVIGASGNTGNSTGPHLHYEVRLNGQPVDPSNFIP